MLCLYRRKQAEKENEVCTGSVRRTGGAVFTLFSEKGLSVDRVFQKSPSFFEGVLYIATTDTVHGIPALEDKAKPLAEREAREEAVPGRRRQVFVPPPPEGSLVFTKRAYVEPSLLKHFKDYQVEGVQFMFERLRGADGAMLADEMGLGKTFQAIMVMYLFCRAGGKALVVAPCSLVGVWEKEIKKWAGSLRVYNGALKSPKKYAGREDVLLATYERVSMLKETHQNVFLLIVCDEAHRLRTSTSQALCALRELKGKKLLLTGTPFQNSLQEYRTLLSLVDARAEQAKGIPELSSIAGKAVLRRKVERTSLRLPQKDEIVWIIKNEEYAEYLRYYESLGGAAGIQDIQKLRVFLSESPSKWKVFVSLARSILQKKESLVIISRYHRVIEQAVSTLKKLADTKEVPLRHADIVEFHGDMPIREREAALARFHAAGQRVAVLSAKCGAEGLTLVKATKMIIFDSDWNPANDLQAMARIWRLGQSRPVEIHRLFLMGTVDEYILLVQMKKLEIQRQLEEEADFKEAEAEEQLSQCEETSSLHPQEASLVHAWLGCLCTEERPYTSALQQEYSHVFSDDGLLLRLQINRAE
ncbi:hypothetical protein NECID01_0671 [Nematocida sp. AWRm77]|nr:hypothetical protein NECID01_0671 [Nematocida sp. AWRm77]